MELNIFGMLITFNLKSIILNLNCGIKGIVYQIIDKIISKLFLYVICQYRTFVGQLFVIKIYYADLCQKILRYSPKIADYGRPIGDDYFFKFRIFCKVLITDFATRNQISHKF